MKHERNIFFKASESPRQKERTELIGPERENRGFGSLVDKKIRVLEIQWRYSPGKQFDLMF